MEKNHESNFILHHCQSSRTVWYCFHPNTATTAFIYICWIFFLSALFVIWLLRLISWRCTYCCGYCVFMSLNAGRKMTHNVVSFVLKWIFSYCQSILTVTFEVAGSLSEDALNVFIQVQTHVVILGFASPLPFPNYLPHNAPLWESKSSLLFFFFPHILQDLLWEKTLRNKEGQPMTVIRLKVQ